MKFNKISDTEIHCFLTNDELAELNINVDAYLEHDDKLRECTVQQFFDLTISIREKLADEFNLPTQCIEYIDTTPDQYGTTLKYRIDTSSIEAYEYLNSVLDEVDEYLSDSIESLKKEILFELAIAFLNNDLWGTLERYFSTEFMNLIKKHLSRDNIELYFTKELSSPSGYLAKELIKYINKHPEAKAIYNDIVRGSSSIKKVLDKKTEDAITMGFADHMSSRLNASRLDNTDEDKYTVLSADSLTDDLTNSFNPDTMYNNINVDEIDSEMDKMLSEPVLFKDEQIADIDSLNSSDETKSNFKETFAKLRESIPEDLLDETDGDIRLGDYLDFLENVGDEIDDMLGTDTDVQDKLNFMRDKMEELKNGDYRKVVVGKFNSIEDLEQHMKKLNSWDSSRFLSSLYLSPKNKYILVLSASAPDISAFNSSTATLVNDGVLFPSDKFQMPYIEEHCETLITDSALEVLAGK